MASQVRMPVQVLACVAVAASACAAYGQEGEEASLEVTIRLLPENAVGPEEITRRIELPPAAANAAPPGTPPDEGNPTDDRAGPPTDPARGNDVATEARERGREFGQEVSEQARENRENAGRPDEARPPLAPPSTPSPPGPPAAPPGRP
jgi:hypothetical protein